MTRRLKGLSFLLLGAAILGIACSDDGDEDADYALVSDDKLTVCTDSPYEPFEFQDANDEFTGFDIDILRHISESLDLELEVVVTGFDGIWLKPAAGECDLVGSAMTITPERQEASLFSDPYFDADQSLLVRAEDEATYATLASLAGRNIAVQTGTTGEQYAQDNQPEGATLISFDEPAAMFLALESGEVDAILQDLPVNGYRQTTTDTMVVTETFTTGEQYGFAVDPENEGLIEAVNAALAEMREDGSYDDIFTTWFG